VRDSVRALGGGLVRLPGAALRPSPRPCCGPGKFAIKDKDTAMAAAFAFLRAKGAFPEDDGDDDDEPVYGDDAFDEMNGWS